MINFTSKDRYDFADLQRLVEVLRAPGGCPWDGAQTHLSIRRNFLEEAYEACEGFDLDDPAHMREELGDVLLQVLFHTDIEREAGRFTLDDVCDAECRKLIFRHPRALRRRSQELGRGQAAGKGADNRHRNIRWRGAFAACNVAQRKASEKSRKVRLRLGIGCGVSG